MNPRRRPHLDPHSLHVVQDAIEVLAMFRGIHCPLLDPDQPHDPADALHLAWSLSLQIDPYLPDLIADARCHGYPWPHIRQLLDPSAP